MAIATDGFETDIRTLYRYGIDQVMLPVRRVKDIIDMNDVMANRLRSLCPISEGDPVVVKMEDSRKAGHVTSIFIRCSDGFWDISTDVYDELIDFGDFIKTENGWMVEV